MPKVIYLDSSDFSDLSSEKLRSDDAEVLLALREARNKGTAVILLSPILLSEAVHATEQNKTNSVQRANLMKELCGRNATRWCSDIPKLELTRALDGSDGRLTLEDILSSENEWFGTSYGTESLRDAKLSGLRDFNAQLQKLPRQERRKLRSQLNLSKASARAHWRSLIKSKPWTPDFPANLLDRDLFIDWFIGEKTDEQIQAHLRPLLDDPYLLFKYFVDETGNREVLYNITRSGGSNLATKLGLIGESLIRLAAIAEESGQELELRTITSGFLSKIDLRTLVSSLSDSSVEHLDDSGIKALVSRCPSVSTFIHVWKSYLSTYVNSGLMRIRSGAHGVKTTNTSDFGDLLHVFYAPYVDVFRCDARFGEHLKNCSTVSYRVAFRRRDILSML